MITRLALGFSAMTSPLSVLLIIGAAVVGPVHGQLVVGDRAQCHACWDNQKGAAGCETECAVFRDETLPELCERAMREVGAERKPLVNPEWTYPRETVAMWRIDGLPVRCIPTPQGYRR